MRNPAPHRVLLLEDNLDNSREIVSLLKYLGCHIHVVPCAYSALQQLSLVRPDTVVCATGLRGRNGFQVARELRQGLAGAPARIIGIMDFAASSLQDAADATGFDLHLCKPLTIVKLRAALDARSAREQAGEAVPCPDFWAMAPKAAISPARTE